MSWTIESWANFEQNCNELLRKPENKIDLPETGFNYSTMFLLANEYLEREEHLERESKELAKKFLKDNKPKKLATNKKSKNGKRLEEWQYQFLMEKFMKNSRPDPKRLEKYAGEINVTKDKVKNWFQNYRAKKRREKNFL